jgi:hypothetical protein
MRTFIITLLALAPSAIAVPAVDIVHFDRLHALMQPTAEELKWRKIPWRTSLWQARIDAAAAGKPIYLWEMDGHPLGCT